MAYNKRRYEENHVYESCLRTRDGLPFACIEILNILLLGIMARANRDQKVKLCHFVWLGNHVHILLIAIDPKALSLYYGELMKKTTETWKALFGLKYLDLWKKRISVIELVTPEDVEDRIAYFYLNPASANLVSAIEKYPGLSSWPIFQTITNNVDFVYTRPVKWYRYNELPPLFSKQDLNQSPSPYLLTTLKGFTKETLVLHPNAWMSSFEITDPEEVKAVNGRITQAVSSQQEVLIAHRITEGRYVMGVDQLKREMPTLKGWKSKKNGRRIFVICKNKSLRKQYIAEYKMFCKLCNEARQKVLAGIKAVLWPKGAFIPWFQPLLIGSVSPCLVRSG